MTAVQIILITLVAYLKMTDFVTFQFFAFNTIVCGWLVGLIMGDAATGLYVGATLQLMSMGVVAVGPTVVNAVLDFMPAWFTTGLSIAGGVLPGVGMAMLLMYMPFSKYWSFLIIGFVLMAYLNVPVLGVGAVGLAAAYEVYKKEMRAATAPAGAASSLGDLEDE